MVIKLNSVAKKFLGPVAMDSPKDGSGRLFICEQSGKIKIVKDGKILSEPFLNVNHKLDRMSKIYSEKGLLGIAFHPKYKTNGRFFIYYSAPSKTPGSDHKSILAEYKVSSNADIADPGSEKIIMEVEQPESNHNGGQLVFGPDGFLYVGLGDGGGAGDEHGSIGNGQDLNTVLGKILRLDIDNTSGPAGPKKPYGIPSDNPFVNNKNARSEIWAFGLRNPWRFSFDRKTGELFCADVGQNKWEEINIIEAGKNYGWRIMEGNHCYDPSTNCVQKDLVPPIAEYNHDVGISITGGFVYRGKVIPFLVGKYVFGDWKGKLFYLEKNADKWNIVNMVIEGKKDNDIGSDINSFGEDENGEIYILTQKFTGNLIANGEVFLISGN
ncbi:MAG: PQQ-dependent sugar dehydrogenase [Bacteroidota bacterium]